MAVNIFFMAVAPEAAGNGGLLKKAAAAALGRAFAKGTVNVVYTGDAGIKKLNRQFLGKNRPTDVIAFNYPPAPGPGAVLGEVYVCVPQARRQAKAMGHELMTELLVLTVHGALHLAGMDDATQALRTAMNRKTARLLKKILA